MQKGGGGEGDRDVRRKGAHTFVCAHAQIREVMDADAGAVYICMKTHTHTYACMQIHYVDAPVAMLRVYWMCPGVSATMNLRLLVAKNL